MKREGVQDSFVEKLERVKKAVAGRFPGLEMRDFHQIMGKLAHYHYEKRKCLLVGESRALYDFLLERGFHPFTVYRWLLLARVPDDVRFQVRQGRMSQKRAFRVACRRRLETSEELLEKVRVMGLQLVRRL